jgi:hypothetical protein
MSGLGLTPPQSQGAAGMFRSSAKLFLQAVSCGPLKVRLPNKTACLCVSNCCVEARSNVHMHLKPKSQGSPRFPRPVPLLASPHVDVIETA